jgi:shikimate kinase
MHSSGKTIFLTAKPDTILDRLKQDPGRPLSDNKSPSEIMKLMEEREPSYMEAADVCFETDDMDPSSIASEIILFLHHFHLL